MSYLDPMTPVKKQVAATAAHPKIAVMVEAAITTLAARKGSSLHAIKKYISENYAVDGAKLSTYIKKFLKAAVENGDVIQTSGKGATGSFKINKKAKAKQKAHKVKPQKPLMMETSNLEKQAGNSKKIFNTETSNLEKQVGNRKKILNTEKTSAKLLGIGHPATLDKNARTEFTGDQEMSDDSALTKPKRVKKPRFSIPSKSRKSKNSLPIKVKKPKKPLAKVSVSPKEKHDNATTSSRLVKPEGVEKSVKAKKSPKLKEPAASNMKKTVSKDVAAEDGPSNPIFSKSKNSKISLPIKMKKAKKPMPKATVSPKGKPVNTVTSPQLAKPEASKKSTVAKKNLKSKEPAAVNLKNTISKKISAEDGPRFPIPSISGKSKAYLPTKEKNPNKLSPKANLQDSLLLYPFVTPLVSPIGVSSKGKPLNTVIIPQLENSKGAAKSTKTKEIPKHKKTQLRL